MNNGKMAAIGIVTNKNNRFNGIYNYSNENKRTARRPFKTKGSSVIAWDLNKSNRTTMRPLSVYFIGIFIYILDVIQFLMIWGDFGGFA